MYDAFKEFEYEVGSATMFFLHSIQNGTETKIAIKSLIEYLSIKNKLSKNIKNALIYPTIVVVLVFIAMIVITTTIMPKFYELYEQNSAALPIYTIILFKTSIFITKYFKIIH